MIRFLLYIFCLFICHTVCIAKTVVNPVFDRTDTPSFRIERIEITTDTTFVTCLCDIEKDTWINISNGTYIQDVATGKRYTILKVEGIPFSPNKMYFEDSTCIQVILYFPHIEADKINLIESEVIGVFNIYGINLNETFNSLYLENDIVAYYKLADTEKEHENWESAINYTLKQLDASKFIYGKRSYFSSCAMYNLTLFYFHTKEYDEVIRWGNETIDIITHLPQDSISLDLLARTYGNLSTAYRLKGEYDTANLYQEKSLETRRFNNGIGTLNYEEYLVYLSRVYYADGNYPKALLYGKESANIYESKFKNNSFKYGCAYIHTLGNLCELYQKMEKYEEAVKVGRQAIQLIENGVCKDSLWLKLSINCNLAGALAATGETDSAISCLETALTSPEYTSHNRLYLNSRMLFADILLQEKKDTIRATKEYEDILKILEENMTVEKNYAEYIEILHKLSKINIEENQNLGLQYLKKSIQFQKKWYGEHSITYANLLLEYVNNTFLKILIDNEEIDSLLLDLRQSSEIIKRHINNSVYNMSKNERDTYWQRYRYVYTWLIPTISGIVRTDASSTLAYDAALFYKGMTLSSEREFKDVILSSGDDDLINLFHEYTNNLSHIEKLYSSDSVFLNIDSLKSHIRNEEYLLSQKATRFNRQYKGTNFSWNEVKNKLNRKDVAIEFVSYTGLDGTKTYYDAYVINNESESPQLISLFNESKLKELFFTDSIDYRELGTLVWGNEELYNAIKDYDNIYFSTSGMLNTIGVEYLPINDNQYIFDRFNLFRLSSTRELCFSNDTTTIKNACLYGGLDYNRVKNGDDSNKTDANSLSRSFIESLVQRGGFDPLLGSKQETEQVQSEMENNAIKCVVYKDSEGTEESFKKLSGSHINIIHLSTHGMYVPNEKDDIGTTNNFRFIISNENPDFDEEDKVLSRSFLVMSGGNMLIYREDSSKEREDGILTALEISKLDFTNLDLVVLSACQTALGGISSEGVYGLQRGFKKAGANTIIMSLDKVDDEATSILMVEFYKNLMGEKTKHQSLKDAQKHLRSIENGKFDHPKYWASFIMLDGLN